MMEKNRDNNSQKKNSIFPLEHWQVIALFLMVYDALAVNISYFLALMLRFDFRFSRIEPVYLEAWLKFLPFYTVLSILTFVFLRLYRSLWRFASYSELLRVSLASVITFCIQLFGTLLFIKRMPISYYVIGGLLQFILILGIRFSYRFILLLKAERLSNGPADEIKNVMMIGAGSAGQMILRDIRKNGEGRDRVCCFIDDNKNKWKRYVEGVPIVGGREFILAAVDKYHIDKIYLAIPSASAADKRDILNICKETDCELKQLPGMYQLVTGQVTVSNLKNVSIEDLLGRDPIKTDMAEVFDSIHGKRVMVTGGGGTIGSELARQIAAHGPSLLLLFDVYENNVYDIQLELRDRYPDLNLVVLIGSVRDSRKIYDVFHKYKPQIVYHAAAHKHVPLMEDSPAEAIKNNVIGTYKTAYAAMVHGTEQFVLISTDKAVNPTSIMGASKRLCEMVLQSFNAKIAAGKTEEIPQLFTHEGCENADKDGTGAVFHSAHTKFAAVRFGNVLGSSGSVIPIFKRQIANGQDLTVTHPDIIRFFMTIPEAVSLVMLAGTYAKGGEIFVLDMGSPVKIVDLARNMIRLSGLRLGKDINIVYTGLRPGEKLYEEKLMAEEGLLKTQNDLIHVGLPLKFDVDNFFEQVTKLMADAYANKEDMKERVQKIVTTYHPETRQF